MAYEPIVISVEMSQYGYWIVTLSIKPGLRMPVMICKVGITTKDAVQLAMTTTAAHSAKKGSQ